MTVQVGSIPYASIGAMSLAPSTSPAASGLAVLSSAFAQYTESVELAASDGPEGYKKRIFALEQAWHSAGLAGRPALDLIVQLRQQLGLESMMPEHFMRFYRFLFHILKEPQRKHVQVEVAADAWDLVLMGRFRLLDQWREFLLLRQESIKVVNEDQWRQVLDFARTVHEDLSNFDANGAWAWILDEFVEHLRKACSCSRAHSMDADMVSSGHLDSLMVGRLIPMSPRCGSKRRSPDVDVVAQQLQQCPLPSSASSEDLSMLHNTKRHCSTESQLRASQAPTIMFELPMLVLPQRRNVRTRRSGVSDLVNRTVTDALGLNE